MNLTDANLSHLHPVLQPLCQDLLAQCISNNIKLRVTETWRDPAREDRLHAQGITAATGLTCKHCFMLGDKPASKAFDFALFDADGKYITDGTDPIYLQVGKLGESVGLTWGGRFHNPDWDHFEI